MGPEVRKRLEWINQYHATKDAKLTSGSAESHGGRSKRGKIERAALLASQGALVWDRYAYANNNPLRYNDPTGHCIDLLNCLPVVPIVGAYATLNALGIIPDYQGVVKASVFMGNSGNIEVAAGLAVQGE